VVGEQGNKHAIVSMGYVLESTKCFLASSANYEQKRRALAGNTTYIQTASQEVDRAVIIDHSLK
jgi:hypothetical protein